MIKVLGVIALLVGLVACAPYHQENVYGKGHYPQENESSLSLNSTDPEAIDYDTYPVNWMTITAFQVTYQVTDTLSVIKVKGSCYNPGFEMARIYYEGFDRSGESIAQDGYPFITNKVYFAGTSQLQPSNLVCSTQGTWSINLQIPTTILYSLDKGRLEFSIVAWFKGRELHNTITGSTSVEISPPPLAVEE